MKNGLESEMDSQMRLLGLPSWECEYRYHPHRRWRFDRAWPGPKVALEIEGGTWTGGRHTRGLGYRKDVEKYNEAILLGWRVIRATSDMIRSGMALGHIKRALEVD